MYSTGPASIDTHETILAKEKNSKSETWLVLIMVHDNHWNEIKKIIKLKSYLLSTTRQSCRQKSRFLSYGVITIPSTSCSLHAISK